MAYEGFRLEDLSVLVPGFHVLGARTNELGTITGSTTGTILLWPLYRKVVPAAVIRPRRKVVIEDPAEPVAD